MPPIIKSSIITYLNISQKGFGNTSFIVELSIQNTDVHQYQIFYGSAFIIIIQIPAIFYVDKLI